MIFALQGEHDQDGEEQKDQGERAELGDELFLVPLLALGLHADEAGQHARR